LATISRRRGTLLGRTAIVDDDAFAEAKRQARAFDKVLEGSGPRRALIARAAAEVNLTSRQVYNLLKRYAAERTVSSLLPRRGNSRAKRLNESVEAIIAATLREQWLVEEAPPLAPVVEEIRARCSTAGERPPSYFAVQARIPLLFDAMTIAKARSANPKHVRRLKPRPGYITAPHPLAVCQIDHTPADIHFVEVVNDAGVFVGRPYLTIVVDVFSRAILGFCLTIEKPSSLSVALCLAQARSVPRMRGSARADFATMTGRCSVVPGRSSSTAPKSSRARPSAAGARSMGSSSVRAIAAMCTRGASSNG
jgi:putative transposase